jgi:formylglycine-generating enzyme required for sulfatase activity
VVLVAVPQTTSADPRTFYAMENKVWNDLYAAFLADPKAERLLKKYAGRPGCDKLVRGDWRKGGWSSKVSDNPDKEPFFGVEGRSRGRLPVFRVTVTEAHCFAEWLGGRLPTRRQWRKAAGDGEDPRPGPFAGDPRDKNGLAVGPLEDGPWPVDRGERDVSIYGCRQVAGNGEEWTRDLADEQHGEATEVPLNGMKAVREVYTQGQSYLAGEPLTFQAMDTPTSSPCTAARWDVTFRIVLEQ